METDHLAHNIVIAFNQILCNLIKCPCYISKLTRANSARIEFLIKTVTASFLFWCQIDHLHFQHNFI